jgi:CO dehydrogenase maturation factor
VRSVLGELLTGAGPGRTDVIVDMEAGLEHLSRGTTRHVDTLLAVAEPYYRSLETARRVCELAGELGIGRVRVIANKVRTREEADALHAYAAAHGLGLLALVPFDDAVTAADLSGGALLDGAPADAPAVRALDDLARELIAAEPLPRTGG